MQIDSLLSEFQREGTPGISIAVMQDNEVLFSAAYGYANLEESIPATTATNYRLASVTKQFTAAVIALLIKDGKLALDDEARMHLPDLSAYAGAVTIRQLIAHTSGLPDYEDLMRPDEIEQVKDRDVLALLHRARSLYFEPGTRFRYSNGGYALLALIAERVSEARFADVLQDLIFGPLGMHGTVAHEEGVSTVRNRAYGYTARGSTWERTDQSPTSAVLGDGGIYSSIDDLILWHRGMAGPFRRVLSVQPMPGDGPGHAYDFGWHIDEYNGWRRERHEGETVGFRNEVQRYTDRGMTIIILTNRNDADPRSLAEQIALLPLDAFAR